MATVLFLGSKGRTGVTLWCSGAIWSDQLWKTRVCQGFAVEAFMDLQETFMSLSTWMELDSCARRHLHFPRNGLPDLWMQALRTVRRSREGNEPSAALTIHGPPRNCRLEPTPLPSCFHHVEAPPPPSTASCFEPSVCRVEDW